MKTEAQRAARRRRNARIKEQLLSKLAALRAAGASCATCSGFDAKRGICDTHSDFHGTAVAKPDGLCVDHSTPAEIAARIGTEEV